MRLALRLASAVLVLGLSHIVSISSGWALPPEHGKTCTYGGNEGTVNCNLESTNWCHCCVAGTCHSHNWTLGQKSTVAGWSQILRPRTELVRELGSPTSVSTSPTELSASDSEACLSITRYYSSAAADNYGSKYCSVQAKVISVPSGAFHGNAEEIGKERPYISDVFLCDDLRAAAFLDKPIYSRVFVDATGDYAPGTGYIKNFIKSIRIDPALCGSAEVSAPLAP